MAATESTLLQSFHIDRLQAVSSEKSTTIFPFLFQTVTALFSGSLYAIDAEEAGAKVTSLMQKALPDYHGKEGVVAEVEFPPNMSTVRIAMTRMCSCTCRKA